MITLKPIPREKKDLPKKQIESLASFTVQQISKGKIDQDQMAWVAERVTGMMKKKKELSRADISRTIDDIRYLLSKMQLLKTKKLTALARELFHPGEAYKTNIATFARPRKSRMTNRRFKSGVKN